MSITEWTFAAEAATWMTQILERRVDLPLSRATVEERGQRTRKRRDLTLYDRQGRHVLTGEVKMPDNPEGRSPFQESLVMDAHQKADNIGVEYYFTWNINRCVLWKTFEHLKPITERYIEHFYVLPTPARTSDEIEHPRVQEQIRLFLTRFLERCAAIMTGEQPMLWLPLDEKFLYVWEAALEQPIAQTLRALSTLYEKDADITRDLDHWMREEQGWIISHKDEALIRNNLERAAKFSCFVMASKIIFYKALRRKFRRMRELKPEGSSAIRSANTSSTPSKSAMTMKPFSEGIMATGCLSWRMRPLRAGETSSSRRTDSTLPRSTMRSSGKSSRGCFPLRSGINSGSTTPGAKWSI